MAGKQSSRFEKTNAQSLHGKLVLGDALSCVAHKGAKRIEFGDREMNLVAVDIDVMPNLVKDQHASIRCRLKCDASRCRAHVGIACRYVEVIPNAVGSLKPSRTSCVFSQFKADILDVGVHHPGVAALG